MRASCAERVKKGVKLLDRKSPGWAGKIDCARLDINSPDTCIFGQLYGTYYRGLKILDLDGLEAIGVGFHISPAVEETEKSFEESSELKAAFIEEIKNRL